MIQVLLEDPGGNTNSGSIVKTSRSIDVIRKRAVDVYPWGRVQTAYESDGNHFFFTIEVSNSTDSTIRQLRLEPLALQLPQIPVEYDGLTPILALNMGAPTVLPLTYSNNMVALANEDILEPLLAGFPGPSNPPASTIFPLVVQTGQSTYSDRLPRIDRPVPPGGTLQFRFSLNFGPAGSSLKQLADGVYQRFSDQTPLRFGWTDRRPIGTFFIASTDTGYATNPRGWFNDPAVDTTTPSGTQAFQARVLAWADNSVLILKDMGAQGAIVWDVEGEENQQPITYIGDPRFTSVLAPEFDAVADDFFRRFTDAGLRVGVALRPQQFAPKSDTSPASQLPTEDVVSLVNAKIAYARDRWHATLFYIDSNGDPGMPLDYKVIVALQQANPDVLLIPEHKNFAYYTASAPYLELRQGFTGTPQAVRDTYPTAFSFINAADGPILEKFDDLVRSVSQGDVLLFHGWWNDPTNTKVKAVYEAATSSQH